MGNIITYSSRKHKGRKYIKKAVIDMSDIIDDFRVISDKKAYKCYVGGHNKKNESSSITKH